jgi:hypothetical protein
MMLDNKNELKRVRGLLQLAKERESEERVIHQGGWDPDPLRIRVKVATLTSSASYDRAVRIAKRILKTDDREAIAELGNLFVEDPMSDIGQADKKLHEEIACRLG